MACHRFPAFAVSLEAPGSSTKGVSEKYRNFGLKNLTSKRVWGLKNLKSDRGGHV
jgi:hypothetical protein